MEFPEKAVQFNIVTQPAKYYNSQINFKTKTQMIKPCAKGKHGPPAALTYSGHGTQLQRAGDWMCVICANVNFAFRNECNRCGLISKEQNEHHNTLLAYSQHACQTGLKGLPCFLTPLRKKDKYSESLGLEDRSPDHEKSGPCAQAKALSVSPVLRQLGL